MDGMTLSELLNTPMFIKDTLCDLNVSGSKLQSIKEIQTNHKDLLDKKVQRWSFTNHILNIDL